MKNSTMRRFGMAFVIAMMAGGLAACEEEGPAEQAGEEMDQAVEDAGESMEDMGEEMEESAEEATN
ncbi:hypothetical protein NFH98_02270 [Halomonas sp. H33-56]|uniref:hypothetical protein n=1 Tax=Halomonas sp. H33-56 TaxID=2950873 RepID=UPI0032E017EF